MMPSSIDIERIRRAFPALASDTVFLENAGGSQVPAVVADRMRDYLLHMYVQLDAGYPLSRAATRVVERAHRFAGTLVNAGTGTVILGPSTSALIRMLSECMAERLEPGSEIVLAECGHEANLGPWTRLEALGVKIRWWRVDPTSTRSPMEGLEALLGPRTAIVAFPHVSNLLGEIMDIAGIVARAHAAGARVVADGVAYAPHRPIDVEAWEVDWYVYSAYKVYGPHMAVLYGREDAAAELTGPNHFFIPRGELPYKFELGGVSHEGCAGLLALGDYLRLLAAIGRGRGEGRADDASAESAGVDPAIGVSGDPAGRVDAPGGCDRATVEAAFSVMKACERPVQERLLAWLAGKPGVRVIGPAHAGEGRVPTVSFVHERLTSREIVAEVDRSGLGIRHGHMYAYRLCEALGFDPEDGVVRVSAVHYNTVAEIDRLTGVLDRVLPG